MHKIVFIGLGAVGATFAAQFLEAGCEVQVLCSRERKERYLAAGFTVNGRPRSFTFVTPGELPGRRSCCSSPSSTTTCRRCWTSWLRPWGRTQ